jgi:hypothetical protein
MGTHERTAETIHEQILVDTGGSSGMGLVTAR